MSTTTTSTTRIDSYMDVIEDSIVLSAACEKELARKLRDTGDRLAENKLIRSQLRFVVYIARRYSGYGLPIEDLVQEGNVGLTKAIRRFDPDKGTRLTTFVSHSIRSEILDYVMRNWAIVKIATTAEQRKLFFKLRSSKKTLGALSDSDVEKLANDLLVTPKHVREMEMRMAGGDTSIDAPRASADSTQTMTLADTMSDDNLDPYGELEASSEQQASTKMLSQGMKLLDQMSRDVLQAIWLGADKTSIQDVCKKHKIAPNQVRQIEQMAMRKMRRHLIGA